MEFCYPERSRRRSEGSEMWGRYCHPEQSEGSGSCNDGNFYRQQVLRGLTDSSLALRMTGRAAQNDKEDNQNNKMMICHPERSRRRSEGSGSCNDGNFY